MNLKGLRWWIISLIAIATIINYIDRTAINVMWPFIYKEFGIAEVDKDYAFAFITTFFMIAYALGQSITGKMMDKIGTRMGMTVSILSWSISIALHAVAKGLSSFSVFRFMLGFSEAGNWPGATKSNAEWFPVKERSIAQGIFGASASMGGVIAFPIITYLFAAFGWQGTFVAISLLGIIWVIPWLIINKATPDKHPWITKKEQNYILDNKSHLETNTNHTIVYSWKELLNFKKTWSIIASRFFIDPIWWLFVTWLPTFLNKQFDFNIKQIGAFAWFPFLMAAIGGLFGGFFSSYQIKKGVAPVKARIKAISIGSILMLVSLVILAFNLHQLKEQPKVAIGLISITLFGFQFLINNIQTLPSDYFSGKNVGTVAGIGGTAAVFGTIILTWLVPLLTKTSYASIFVLAAVFVPLSWLSLSYFAKENTTLNKPSL